MKKTLLIAIVALFSFSNAQAQLPDGSVAPDWTLTDLNGTSHNLYTYLDNGYTVFIDFSATWCGPCWGYHISGALENLYVDHGPAGMPNVSPTTTDDVMVFFIEGDESTLAALQGGAGSQGDWITGTPYPILPTYAGTNSTQVTSDYEIAFWPTVYKICPDRIVTVHTQPSNPYPLVSACPPPASNNNDARTFAYAGETLTCEGNIVPEIMIQNYGIVNLTSLTIQVSVNGNVVSTTPWTGNLATYATDNITLPALTGLASNDAVTINTTLPNGVVDANPANNPTVSFNVTLATQNTDTDVTVQIVTDQYGGETTWKIKNATGTVVLSGGPYTNLGASGTTTQTPVSGTLAINTCHTFTIYDSYGDGINAGYGAGSFTVTDGNGTILASGGVFTDEDGDAFKTGGGVLAINDLASNLAIYPNPVKEVLTIEGNYTSVDVFDMFGKLVLSSEYTKNINVSTLANGIYMLNITTEKGIQTQKITITK
ncbi:MAG: T9SS type A sorting domain-containing protein [Bacteroidetes bacterium]|nr:T9SS type A sorting domain-containing protein [Bacteroidota bacterium]